MNPALLMCALLLGDAEECRTWVARGVQLIDALQATAGVHRNAPACEAARSQREDCIDADAMDAQRRHEWAFEEPY